MWRSEPIITAHDLNLVAISTGVFCVSLEVYCLWLGVVLSLSS
jgi:hypothetical protein